MRAIHTMHFQFKVRYAIMCIPDGEVFENVIPHELFQSFLS